MNSMLIIASLIAVAVAGPVHRGLVAPGIAGPTPVIDDFTPISVGPALIEGFEQVTAPAAQSSPIVQIIINVNPQTGEVTVPAPVGAPTLPELVLPSPVNVVDNVIAPVVPNPVVIGTPTLPEVVIPGPVNVVDNVVAPIVPNPVVIGTPTLPEVVVPGPVNVVDNVVAPSPVHVVDSVVAPSPVIIGTPVVPHPVAVGTPIIPSPAIVLPETLN